MSFRIQCRAFLLTYNNTTNNLDFDKLLSFFEKEENCVFSVCEEEATRRHFHVYCQYSEKIDRLKSYYAVCDEEPGDVQTNQAKRNFNQQVAEGHFYVYCEYKLSHIKSFYSGKARAHCRAIFHLIQQGKMDAAYAEDCAAKYDMVVGLRAMVNDVDALKTLKKRQRLQQYNELCLKTACSVVTRPWRASDVVAAFQNHFMYVDTRYKFLIIVGPTRLGKTEYAKQLYKSPLVFSQSTNWKEYDPMLHDAVVFDDVSKFEDGSSNVFSYINNNKTLFQSGSVPITLGKSATGMYEFHVNVYRKPLIVCCNHDHFKSRDGSWIDANAFIYEVHEKLFL